MRLLLDLRDVLSDLVTKQLFELLVETVVRAKPLRDLARLVPIVDYNSLIFTLCYLDREGQ